ncbi:hypothetical protein EVA_17056 [gut metagenome]|uniref:Uncharacterized protein n=1 Tax=gut metagenome TaxID=749906 RepID=J9FZ53_9ZZZZ
MKLIKPGAQQQSQQQRCQLLQSQKRGCQQHYHNCRISNRISCSSVRSFVTARSERDSCESYEHEN